MENIDFIGFVKIRFLSNFIQLQEISQIIKNWYSIPLFKMGFIKKIDLVLKNGTVYYIKNIADYDNFWQSKEAAIAVANKYGIKFSKNIISFNNIRFRYKSEIEFKTIIYMIRENYIYRQYSKLRVCNKIVLDAGAGIGDTAIFFSKKGAKKVIALEPIVKAYRTSVENIKINKIKNVELLNYGLSNKIGFIKIKDDYSGPGTKLETVTIGTDIKIVSLDYLVKKYNLNNAILKMDIEGGEYNSILASDSFTLKRFDEIIIEYHNGYFNLKEKLQNCGFKVSLLDIPIQTKEGVRGLIFAKNNNNNVLKISNT